MKGNQDLHAGMSTSQTYFYDWPTLGQLQATTIQECALTLAILGAMGTMVYQPNL